MFSSSKINSRSNSVRSNRYNSNSDSSRGDNFAVFGIIIEFAMKIAVLFAFLSLLQACPVNAQVYGGESYELIPSTGTIVTSNLKSVRYAYWSDLDGQDDLVWSIGGTILRPDYREQGVYHIHLYTMDMCWIGALVYDNSPKPAEPVCGITGDIGAEYTVGATVDTQADTLFVSGRNLKDGPFEENDSIDVYELTDSHTRVPAGSTIAGPDGSFRIGVDLGQPKTYIVVRNSEFVIAYIGEYEYAGSTVVVTEADGNVSLTGIPEGYCDYAELTAFRGGKQTGNWKLEPCGNGTFGCTDLDIGHTGAEYLDLSVISNSYDEASCLAASSCCAIGRLYVESQRTGLEMTGFTEDGVPSALVDVDVPGLWYTLEKENRTLVQQGVTDEAGQAVIILPDAGAFAPETYTVTVVGNCLGQITVSRDPYDRKISAVAVSGRQVSAVSQRDDVYSIDISGTRAGEEIPGAFATETQDSDGVYRLTLGTVFDPAQEIAVSAFLCSPSDPETGMSGAVAKIPLVHQRFNAEDGLPISYVC